MFLKIIKETDKEQIENIYECNDIQITKRKEGIIFSLDRTSPQDNIAIVVDGETTRFIYLMNDYGKTIDTIVWNNK